MSLHHSVHHALHLSRVVLQAIPLATIPLALQVMLRNLAGRREFRFTGNADQLRGFLALPSEERASHTLLHGHVPFGIDAALPEPAVYLTMLRDPIETAVALYYLILASPSHYLHAEVAGKGWTLEDFATAGRPEIDNPMVRWLNPRGPARLPFGGVTGAMLGTAKANLRDRYIFGLAERFDESMLLLAATLGWPDVSYTGLGAPPRVRLADVITPAAADQLRDINRLDIELHRFATELFEAHLAGAFPRLEESLAEFRERNRARPGTINVGGTEIELAAPPDSPGLRDIVWLASYPRSGNTWVRFLLDAYFFSPAQHLNDLSRLSMELDWWLGVAREHGLPASWIAHAGRAYQQRRPRPPGFPDHLFIKTHFPRGPAHPLVERTRAAVYLVRDPRDVLLSGLNFSELSTGQTVTDPRAYARHFAERGGDDAWLLTGYGPWEAHAQSWLEGADFPVLSVRYEDLKADPAPQFVRILEFLGVPVDAARVEQTVARTSFERLRSLEVASRATTEIAGMVRSDRFFFHKGLSGQSLAHLGEDVEREFLERFGPARARYGYA
jgi:hypothetical protein